MTDDNKVELHLLPGAIALDLDALVELYTQIVGRAPTEAELAEARALIEQHAKRD